MIREISGFDEFMSLIRDGVVVADFYTTWCLPCKLMEPVLEEVESRFRGRVTVVRVDCEKNMDLASRFSVMSVPTVIVFSGGREVRRVVGFSTRAADEIVRAVMGAVRGGR
ncbi:MAG: thiol reductase thioredoxin [Thermoprotei archaeon]|nr:MAG: thiol reductase thioredoxin [Thermoprotei archaeon]